MRLAKRRIARRVGFEKCLIPWKELMRRVTRSAFSKKNYKQIEF